MRKEEIEKKTKEMLDNGFSKPYVACMIARMKEESRENESRERMYKYVDESSLH
jgi:hypothetical protein